MLYTHHLATLVIVNCFCLDKANNIKYFGQYYYCSIEVCDIMMKN